MKRGRCVIVLARIIDNIMTMTTTIISIIIVIGHYRRRAGERAEEATDRQRGMILELGSACESESFSDATCMHAC